MAFPVVCDLPLEAVKLLCLEEDWKSGRQKVPWVREGPFAYAVMFCAKLVKQSLGILVFLSSVSKKKKSAPL